MLSKIKVNGYLFVKNIMTTRIIEANKPTPTYIIGNMLSMYSERESRPDDKFINDTTINKNPRITSYNVCYTKLLRITKNLVIYTIKRMIDY